MSPGCGPIVAVIGRRDHGICPVRSVAAVNDGHCEECGAPEARTSIDGAALCDRCADRRLAGAMGVAPLPEPPGPFVLSDLDGGDRQFTVRLWRAPAGIVASAEEAGAPVGEGYYAEVLGGHDADALWLVAEARRRVEAMVSVRQLGRDPHRPGWLLRGDAVEGRLVWPERGESDGPYDVVIDGRVLSWDELG